MPGSGHPSDSSGHWAAPTEITDRFPPSTPCSNINRAISCACEGGGGGVGVAVGGGGGIGVGSGVEVGSGVGVGDGTGVTVGRAVADGCVVTVGAVARTSSLSESEPERANATIMATTAMAPAAKTASRNGLFTWDSFCAWIYWHYFAVLEFRCWRFAWLRRMVM